MAASGTMVALNPAELFALPEVKEIGIQLYSIRDLVENELPGSLQKLAAIGYRTIETAHYQDGKFYGMNPAAFKELVESTGLRALSSHSSLSLDNIESAVEDAVKAGMKYLVLPSIPADRRKTIDDYKTIAGELNQMGEVCRMAGLILGYHNHAFEFEKIDDQIPYDVLLENTDAELVTMQIDTYWIHYGGYSSEEYFKKFPGRFKMWHIKDMVDGEGKESTEIGSGILDFQSIYKLRKKAGMECMIVEQEHFEMDPWESLAISWKYLNNL